MVKPTRRIVGIDLGTTNSVVAVMEGDHPRVIQDAEGRRLTPSVVSFSEGEGEPLVGVPAQRQRILHPQETVYSVKRFMGRRGSEIGQEKMVVTYPVVGEGEEPVRIRIRDRFFLPEEISAWVLRKLKQDAERDLQAAITRAVITVPAYFNDAQRSATKRAGELAGLRVERIINEPTAACLAYGLDKALDARVAVYDLGGGTFDISILQVRQGVFQVLSTCGNTRLGGDDLDRRLVDWILEEAHRDGIRDLERDPMVLSRIREEAERVKCLLSEEERVQVRLPFLVDTYSLERTLTRQAFEDMVGDILERTRRPCLQALMDAGLESHQVDEVILVGGSTRIPRVRRLVEEIFGRPPNTQVNPDEAVALGAAIQGRILEGGLQEMLLLDVTPLSLGIETYGGFMNVIIPRNTTIPTRAGEIFTTAVDNQRHVTIHVLQGERPMARDNWSLGEFVLEDIDPAPAGVPRIGVEFTIDADGILHVLARDLRTGKEKRVRLKSAVEVPQEEVERMVRESLEHAQEDAARRAFAEAKLEADQILRATRKALERVGNQLDPSERQTIQEALQRLEAALAREEAEPVREATRHLDQVTQNLARILMESTLEEVAREQKGEGSSSHG